MNCYFCDKEIDLSDGWGLTENVDTGETKVYHLECAEMNGHKTAVPVE